MYNTHISAYPSMDDAQYQAQSLTGFGMADAAASAGRAPSPLNGDRLDVPQTPDQLMASLRTRVSELEVINDFMQRRLAMAEYTSAQEGQDANGQTEAQQLRAQLDQLKTQLEQSTQSESQLKMQLEESHRRENMLKRRLDEMEKELDAKSAAGTQEESERAAKKPRLDDPATNSTEDVATKLEA